MGSRAISDHRGQPRRHRPSGRTASPNSARARHQPARPVQPDLVVPRARSVTPVRQVSTDHRVRADHRDHPDHRAATDSRACADHRACQGTKRPAAKDHREHLDQPDDPDLLDRVDLQDHLARTVWQDHKAKLDQPDRLDQPELWEVSDQRVNPVRTVLVDAVTIARRQDWRPATRHHQSTPTLTGDRCAKIIRRIFATATAQ